MFFVAASPRFYMDWTAVLFYYTVCVFDLFSSLLYGFFQQGHPCHERFSGRQSCLGLCLCGDEAEVVLALVPQFSLMVEELHPSGFESAVCDVLVQVPCNAVVALLPVAVQVQDGPRRVKHGQIRGQDRRIIGPGVYAPLRVLQPPIRGFQATVGSLRGWRDPSQQAFSEAVV